MSKDVGPSLPVIAALALIGLLMPQASAGSSERSRVAGSQGKQGNAFPSQYRVKGNGETTWAGADATRPDQIPVRGWWAVLKRAAAGFNEDRLMTEAAAVTFYTLLAIFPAIATIVSLYGLIANPATVNDHLASLSSVVPGGGMDIISAQVKSLTANPTSALGFGAIFGFAASLWSANQGIKAMFGAMNVVYHEKERRSFFRFTAVSLLFTFGAVVFIAVAMGSVAIVPITLDALGLHDITAYLLAAVRWPVLMIILTFILALIYRYGPSRERARWEWVTWGSGLATVVWLIASLAFSYYVANFGTYNKTYGSLGAAIGFMTWIWISIMIVLMGAELNAELEHQTERDSTTGPEMPMGQRGAFKADNKANDPHV